MKKSFEVGDLISFRTPRENESGFVAFRCPNFVHKDLGIKAKVLFFYLNAEVIHMPTNCVGIYELESFEKIWKINWANDERYVLQKRKKG